MAYIEALEKYKSLVSECTKTSQKFAGIKSPTNQHFHASVLFTKICTTAISLTLVLPENKTSTRHKEHWDFSAAASLARSIIECYFIFYYLCIERINTEEWYCRWNILNLHDCTARYRLFLRLEETESAKQFNTQAEELRQRLRTNNYFLSLSDGSQKEFLKGRKAFLLTQDDIAARIGIEKNIFRGIYEFLSAQIHSLPLSFYRMGDGSRGRGIHSEVEERYTEICVSYAIDFLSRAQKDMIEIFSSEKNLSGNSKN